ncbi:MAG: universal stress protein [Arenicellales bacterium]
MSYKDILVAVEPSQLSPNVTQCAAEMAGELGAHLTALYLGSDPLFGFAESQLPADLLETHRGNLALLERRERDRFEKACRLSGVIAEWRSTGQGHLSALVLSARYADLVVLSARTSKESGLIAHHYRDGVVLAAGRPALMLPESCTWAHGFGRIMVAWESSREASRAVHDAMPLLQMAREVTVMEITDGDVELEREPGADIAGHLARHGVSVQATYQTRNENDVGAEVLSASVDCGADLIVAGAYGHSRLREYALGGVTRHLMAHSKIPLLLSH